MDQHPEDRTPLNAPGPFFVLKDCCIQCRAPEAEAPKLMSFDKNVGTCFFHRQPMTSEETARAVLAVAVACCGAVRYGGDDPAIRQRLRELS